MPSTASLRGVLLAVLVHSLPACAGPSPRPEPAAGAAAPLGDLDVTVTGSPACKRAVREGLLALHSFLYDRAHEVFGAALRAEPGCAMAAWGDAMTFDHPLWGEREVKPAREALAAVVHEESLTPKERGLLAAARALYLADEPGEAHQAWLWATAALHRDFPDDDEAALQHSLALQAVFAYDRDHLREQMEAGAIALDVLARRPLHPGAAHYVIHAFDSPEHAILALPAARLYARIAPAAGHAQHMPSHTFTHLGMWREVVPSNEQGYAASVAWARSRGQSPSLYDWHSYSWLVAARLELGQATRARKLIDEARAFVVQATDDSADLREAYADMVADYVSQTGRWSELEPLAAPLFAPMPDEGKDGHGPVACASHAPGGKGMVRLPSALFARMIVTVLRAEAALHGGDGARAAAEAEALRAQLGQLTAWTSLMPPAYKRGWELRADALAAQAKSLQKPSAETRQQALELLVKRRSLPTPIAGPAFRRTPRELLGEALLAAGKPKEALAEYEAELAARPNRALSLLGTARAAKAAGDAERARARFTTLAALWSEADPEQPFLAEVRAGAAESAK